MAESLIQFAESGDTSQLQRALSKVTDVNATVGGETALHAACSKGQLKAANMLLSAGADIHKPDGHGFTGLHHAVIGNNTEIVKSLLAKGASPSAQTEKKQNVFHVCSRFGSIDTLNCLLNDSNSNNSNSNQDSITDCLLEKDLTARTPLHYATKRGIKEIIIALLRKKVQAVQIKDASGCYPFQYLSLPPPETPKRGTKSRDLDPLAEDLKALWSSDGPEIADIQVRFDDGSSLRAHKAILYARCPVLKKSIKPNIDEITISHVDKQAMQFVLEYVYTGRIDDFDETSHSLSKNPLLCFRILKAAHQLELPLLEEQAEKYLLRTLDAHSLAEIISVCEETFHPWPLLKKAAGDFLLRNFSTIAERDDFPRISKDFIIDAVQAAKILPRETNSKKPKGGRRTTSGSSSVKNEHSSSNSSSTTGAAHDATKLEENDMSVPPSTVASLRDGPGSDIATSGKVAAKCKAIIKSLCNDKNAWPFLTPVDPVALGIPDYFDVIKHPMDLGTIKKRVDTGYYSTIAELNFDVHLTFNNALTYNIPGSDICIMAAHLLDSWKKKYGSLLKQIAEQPENWKVDSLGTPSSSSSSSSSTTSSTPSRNSTPASSSSKSKGRASVSEPEKKKIIPMTYEEKRRLGEQINELDSEQLHKVVDIISKTVGRTENEQDLEVDMNDLGDETLRELEAYVQSCIDSTAAAAAASASEQHEAHEEPKKSKKKRPSSSTDFDDDGRERKEKSKHKKQKTQ